MDKISAKESDILLESLEKRFKENMERHPDIQWDEVLKKIQGHPEKLYSLFRMEETGGEPDILGNEFIFVDCSPESPQGRRSTCYDRAALESRKKNKPKFDAESLTQEMGISMLTVDEYQKLQLYGAFDLKSSSWVQTPGSIRKLGGALFGDRRYDTMFIYHNGVESYYSNRGFRGKLTL